MGGNGVCYAKRGLKTKMSVFRVSKPGGLNTQGEPRRRGKGVRLIRIEERFGQRTDTLLTFRDGLEEARPAQMLISVALLKEMRSRVIFFQAKGSDWLAVVGKRATA